MANGAFTTSRRLHMRLLSALETFVRVAAGRGRCASAALARRWLAFHITFATFAARTRLFSTCTPLLRPTYPPSSAPHRVFLHFSLRISHLDDRASYRLLSFVCVNLRAVLIITITLRRPETYSAAMTTRFYLRHIRIVSIKKPRRRIRVSHLVARNPRKNHHEESPSRVPLRHRREPNLPFPTLQKSRCYARVCFLRRKPVRLVVSDPRIYFLQACVPRLLDFFSLSDSFLNGHTRASNERLTVIVMYAPVHCT